MAVNPLARLKGEVPDNELECLVKKGTLKINVVFYASCL